MPHSLDPEPKPSQATIKDEPMDETGIDAALADANDDDVDMVQVPSDTEAAVPTVKKESRLDALLFDDVDSDEEFPSSAPVKQPPTSPPAAPASPM